MARTWLREGATMTTRALTFGGTTYPLVLPSIRDPRLHVASVIITVHVLGQLGLGFAVSVPQILAAILTCAVLEVAITFRQTRSFVWPASAMLTGSGVALILRAVGTEPGQHWTFEAWYLFAAIAGLSLLTKYVIRYRGVHVFNPSNVGLVVAFVLLGSTRIEPLDFWWAPLNMWMIAAYAAIIGGGVLITRRLHLLTMAVAFWVGLAVGLAILAASGHCMTARWAFSPVCGFDFWRAITASPEVMVFGFFMLTDPRTVPGGQVARIAFALSVAATATLLIAPQANEFGAKVGLLAGLVVLCAARPLFDRFFPAARTSEDRPLAFGRRWLASGTRASLTAVTVLALGGGIALAGAPARGLVLPDAAEVLARVPHHVDPATLPPITVEQEVADWDHTVAGPEMQGIVLTLAENLEVESQALLRRDPSILAAVDHGDRLAELQQRIVEATRTGTSTIAHYQMDAIDVRLLVPFGMQTSPSLGFDATGTLVRETYDASGRLQSRESEPFALTFAMRRATGDRWLNVAVLPLVAGADGT